MKKEIFWAFLLMLFLFIQGNMFAQVAYSYNYTFSSDSSSRLDLDYNGNTINMNDAANLVGNGATNLNTSLQDIGFDFYFMGLYYSHFIAGTNGQIALGINHSPAGILSPSNPNDLTRMVNYPPLGTDDAPVLAPFWDKMITADTGTTIRTMITGTFPNRCRVVEWKTIINNPASTGAPYTNFQVRLYEKSGVIEYVYGIMQVKANATLVTASVGFTHGYENFTFTAFTSLNPPQVTYYAFGEPSAQLLVNSAEAGNIPFLHSPTEGNRRRLTFTPPVLNPPVPNNLQVIGSGSTGAKLKWSNVFTNARTYAVYKSTDGTNFTYAGYTPGFSDTFTVTGLSNNTTYYFKVVGVTEGYSGESNVVTVNTSCSMQGTYSIGPGGNFRNIRSAFNQLAVFGMAGNVIFELQPDYNPLFIETFPLTLPGLTENCSNGYTATLRPAQGVSSMVIDAFSYSPAFVLNGVNYLVVDGRPGGAGNSSVLTFSNQLPTGVFNLINSSGNRFRYVKFTDKPAQPHGNTPLVSLQGSAGAGCDNNTFENCDFNGGGNYTPKPVLFYSAGTSAISNDGNAILNCNFFNFSRTAIHLNQGNNGSVARYNSFYSTGAVLRFHDSVSVIRINTAGNTDKHVVSQNYFGGSKPHSQGAAMEIFFNDRFFWTDITGRASVDSNYFARMSFKGDLASRESDIRFVYVNNYFNSLPCTVSYNRFGGASLADSIYLFADDNFIKASCIHISGDTHSVTNNSIKNFQCYGNYLKTVSLKLISTYSGNSNVRNNEIGSSMYRSVANYSSGDFIGIWSYLSNAVIVDNVISHITAYRFRDEAGLHGIYINGGYVDSIYNNRIFNIESRSQGMWYRSIFSGIMVFPHLNPASTLHNLIAGNHIYNLNNNGQHTSDLIAGIKGFADLLIRGNLIHSISAHNPQGAEVCGIQVNEHYSSIHNNMISLGFDSSGRSIRDANVSFEGISGGSSILHNSVYIGGDSVLNGSAGSNCISFLVNSLQANVYNNIFFNARSNQNMSSVAEHRCIVTNSALNAGNNMYYFTGTDGVLGRYQDNTLPGLAAWQSATGTDAGSFYNNPGFLMPDGPAGSINLHLAYASVADMNGDTAHSITYDFDMETRASLSPADIGADAVDVSSCYTADAGRDTAITKGNSVQLGGSVVNNGHYSWRSETNSFFSSRTNPVVTPDSTMPYILTITNGPCISVDTVMVVVMPAEIKSLCANTYSYIDAPINYSFYQWQVDSGSGFKPVSDDGIFHIGASTSRLQLLNLPSDFYGFAYQCIADGMVVKSVFLKFENSWTGAVNNLWSESGNWSCEKIPDGKTDVIINSGNVVLNQNGTCRSLSVTAPATFTIMPGIVLTITR